MKTIILVIAVFGFGIAFGQKGVETITFKTSAVCDMCQERIEDALNYTSGVKFAELDLETKIVTVQYKATKITKESIIEVINRAGYDADESPAVLEAYQALPACCKKGSKCESK